ncbi:hypothetical protein ABTZ46_19700 [Nocardioides sp. NPDC126508]
MNDIETLLRTSSRQTLDLPAAEILRRGDRMRRRRRTGKVAAAVAAFSVAGVMAYVAIPDRLIDSDVATPAPEKHPVDWSGEPTNLTPEELDELSDRCLESAWQELRFEYDTGRKLVPEADNLVDPDDVERIPAGTWPFLAEKRGATTKAIFDGTDYGVTCSATASTLTSVSGHHLASASGTPIVWDAFEQTGPWEHFSRGSGGDMSEFILPLPEELNVTKVVFTLRGKDIPATVVNDMAVAWTENLGNVASASFRAYDADGKLVHDEAPEPPTVEWTETAEGIRVTRSLGNETVESAWFWVGEQRFDATITEANVAVALIPTGTLTTDQLDRLQIQGLSPEGLSMMGCTGGPCGP